MDVCRRLLLLCFLFELHAFSSHGKKQIEGANLIQKVEDVKSFKKLLRTKTNILALFAKDEKTATKQFKVLGEAAIKSKGIGTLAWINCSQKEGKKLCKKHKQGLNGADLVHFKDGEFSSVYDRKLSALSIFSFLKDPKSDGPWVEEDGASDVVHLSTEKQLNSLLKKNKPTLIMFYAPWCGHCKRFKPTFAEVATEVKGKTVLAGYDADTNADAHKVRERFNVTGFPKTLYFEKGKFKFEYSAGHSKDDLTGFLEDPQPPKPKEPEVAWADAENDVYHLDEEGFEGFIAENKKVLLFFYAPWCGHCKNLKPEWEKAATQLKEEEHEGKLAALDATKYPALASKFKVTGYPTLLYFEDGALKYTVGGAMTRTQEGIIEYINNPKEPPPPEKAWHETESDVLHLEDSNFRSSLKKKKHALVMFYAPWCGHCKKAKPEYQNAASQFTDDKKVAFAAMDCTTNRNTCGDLDVKGYPTFYYMSYGKNEVKYQSGRTEQDYIRFIKKKLKDPYRAQKKDGDFWKKIRNSTYIYHLTDKTWRDFVEENEKVLVMVYSTECPNCKHARKQFADVAKQALDEKIKVKLAAIDGEEYKNEIYSLWTDDMGVPTLFWYQNGKKQFEYVGQRAYADMLDFIKNPRKPREKKKFPLWETQESASDIEHLNDSNFDQFVADQEDMLVFFHSITSEPCFKIRKSYEKAARSLSRTKPEVAMVAIDVEKSLILKHKYKVEKVPYIGYFKGNKLKYEYNGKRKSKSFIKFLNKPAFIPPPEKEKEWKDMKTNVTILSNDNFVEFLKENKHVMVMFFAKWCGHCKTFKPKYMKAADILKEKDSQAKLAAVDADGAKKLMSHHDVKGLPTLLYFENAKKKEVYKGQRSAEAVVKFMNEKLNSEEKTKKDDDFEEGKPDTVKSLSPENIEEFLDGTPEAFVMFYAPWCSACKQSKQAFYDASLEVAEELPDVKLAIFNAVKYPKEAKKFKIKGYPTFWYFKDSELKFQYYGSRTKRDFSYFLNDPAEQEEPPEIENLEWLPEENSHVTELQTESFDKFLRENKHALVFFVIKHCKICFDAIKPEYEKAAKIAHEENYKTKLAVIRADTNKKLSDELGVTSFPIFLYFKNGKKKYDYKGGWKLKQILKFLKKPSEQLSMKQKPKSWQDEDIELSGNVVHLSNTTFDSFLENHEHALVMFHSLYSKECKEARVGYKESSLMLDELRPSVKLGAVDCYRKPEQGVLCYKFSLRKYPTYKYYYKSEFILDLQVTNTKDVVTFLQSRHKNPDEPITASLPTKDEL